MAPNKEDFRINIRITSLGLRKMMRKNKMVNVDLDFNLGGKERYIKNVSFTINKKEKSVVSSTGWEPCTSMEKSMYELMEGMVKDVLKAGSLTENYHVNIVGMNTILDTLMVGERNIIIQVNSNATGLSRKYTTIGLINLNYSADENNNITPVDYPICNGRVWYVNQLAAKVADEVALCIAIENKDFTPAIFDPHPSC